MSDFPKLVMGHIVSFGLNDEEVTPSDDAVIHLDGDEDSEIEVHCPGALRLAQQIVKAVNNHDALVDALTELHAQVRGECPSLLNEDSGGDARLSMEIERLLGLVGSPVLTHEKGQS